MVIRPSPSNLCVSEIGGGVNVPGAPALPPPPCTRDEAWILRDKVVRFTTALLVAADEVAAVRAAERASEEPKPNKEPCIVFFASLL